jgi:mannitol-1-phosphate/altronate dehydrogenase
MFELTRKEPLPLPAGVAAPRYDLRAVRPGIVHIGLGGFHRSHFARYTHDLMEAEPAALAWGIVGAGLRVTDRPLLQALTQQDGLYTLVERDAEGETRTVVGSIIGTIDASETSAALLAAIVRPDIRIVSITVSEAGYCLDPATKRLDLASDAIARDIASPHAPRTMPGILVEAYRRRRDAGLPGFTALSCDNIQHNGRVLRDAVHTLATQMDPALASWIADHATFPSSMVDRITPVPTRAEIARFAAETGLDDKATVFSETFRQWVIEDDFADGRPDWSRVGAQFVNDVASYEAMKLRLLNASHLAVAGLGALSGYETVEETMADPAIRHYMARLMDEETGPLLAPVPGIELARYKATLIARFANPAIRDTVRRINTDAPINLLLDPLRDALAAGTPIDLLALGLAAWCQRTRDALAAGNQIIGANANAELQALGVSTPAEPLAILSVESLFGDLGRNGRLSAAVRSWLDRFRADGVAATLKRAC